MTTGTLVQVCAVPPEFTRHALTTSSGAGFYLNATNPKYAKHYNMLNHVTIEIPEVVEAAGLPIVRPHCQSV